MYIKFCKRTNRGIELLYADEGSCTLGVNCPGAYNLFKNESGKHCVQRIPPTESKGRRHTSIITVSVLNIPRANPRKIKDSDLEIKTQRGHGKGGQHQNKTDSAVRIKHIPTGISVFINGRDQNQNKQTALSIIEAKVTQSIDAKQHEELNRNRQLHIDGGNRSNKIRTYNFIDNRAVDHRTGIKTNNLKELFKGKLELLYTDAVDVSL